MPICIWILKHIYFVLFIIQADPVAQQHAKILLVDSCLYSTWKRREQ